MPPWPEKNPQKFENRPTLALTHIQQETNSRTKLMMSYAVLVRKPPAPINQS